MPAALATPVPSKARGNCNHVGMAGKTSLRVVLFGQQICMPHVDISPVNPADVNVFEFRKGHLKAMDPKPDSKLPLSMVVGHGPLGKGLT